MCAAHRRIPSRFMTAPLPDDVAAGMAGAHHPQPAVGARLRGRAADRGRRRPWPGLADPEGGGLPRDRPPARRGAHRPRGHRAAASARSAPSTPPRPTAAPPPTAGCTRRSSTSGRSARSCCSSSPSSTARARTRLALLQRAARGARTDRRGDRVAPRASAPASTRPSSPGAGRTRSPPWISSTRSRPPSPAIRSRGLPRLPARDFELSRTSAAYPSPGARTAAAKKRCGASS